MTVIQKHKIVIDKADKTKCLVNIIILLKIKGRKDKLIAMRFEEKTISRKRVFEGKLINLEVLDVSLPNGKIASREVVIHPGASVVIPIDEEGNLYLVRQYRKPIEKESLELPAGKLDPNEAPEICAARELKEETGLEAKSLKYVLSMHTTPGFSNEVLHVFVAKGLKKGNACADEDEFVSTEVIHINQLIKMIFSGEITDGKTITGILIAEKIYSGEIKVDGLLAE